MQILHQKARKITLTGHKHERGSQSSGSERPVPKRNTGVLIEAPPPAYVESSQGSNNGFVPPTNLVSHNPENDMSAWWEWSASVDQRISQLFELSATQKCTNDMEIDPNEVYYEFHKSAQKMLDNFRLESSAKKCQLDDHASRLGEQLQIMVEEKMAQLMSQINLGNHTRETMREFVTTGEWLNLIPWADVVKQYLEPSMHYWQKRAFDAMEEQHKQVYAEFAKLKEQCGRMEFAMAEMRVHDPNNTEETVLGIALPQMLERMETTEKRLLKWPQVLVIWRKMYP